MSRLLRCGVIFLWREFEVALVNRLRAGDATAFDEIYHVFNHRLLNFLSRMAKNRSAAEDLVEEAWLRLIQAGDDLDADTRLGPWLFTVARNLYEAGLFGNGASRGWANRFR